MMHHILIILPLYALLCLWSQFPVLAYLLMLCLFQNSLLKGYISNIGLILVMYFLWSYT
eukprot:UN21160